MTLSTFHNSVSHDLFSTGVSAMSRLILLGFRELNNLKFPLTVLPFFPNALLLYIAFAFYFKKVSTQFGQQVFLVRWDLFDLFWKPCCREITTIWKLAYEITPQTMHFLVRHCLAIDSRKHGSVAFQQWILNIVQRLFIETTFKPQLSPKQWLT